MQYRTLVRAEVPRVRAQCSGAPHVLNPCGLLSADARPIIGDAPRPNPAMLPWRQRDVLELMVEAGRPLALADVVELVRQRDPRAPYRAVKSAVTHLHERHAVKRRAGAAAGAGGTASIACGVIDSCSVGKSRADKRRSRLTRLRDPAHIDGGIHLALVRCANHDPRGRQRVPHTPEGYQYNGLVCGRQGCREPGFVWLTDAEHDQYQEGERIFEGPTSVAKFRVMDLGAHPTRNPYRVRGYTATLLSSLTSDSMDVRRNGRIVCGVTVTVFPAGPDEEASISVKRFVPNELREVRVVDDFDD